ncbi:hypothetical protein [Romboutsia sp.]|uniref:hypothetical protein n=1 Tax=Romboutsia sp. TaxID=1965302 RepID=UPI002CB55A4F|nr:hypothetical protein [Romboutsia sp.]HSQ89371.1 hypothetical protein [Romboutsia sp.]
MKRIGGCVYTHITQRYDLKPEYVEMIQRAEKIFRKNMGMKLFLQMAIVKVNKIQNTVTFTMSDDFDIANDPEVGDAYLVKLDTKEIKLTKARGQVYHDKWMYVSDSYTGFDREQSKRWSERWQSIVPNTKEVKSRIGYKKYWDTVLTHYGLQ